MTKAQLQTIADLVAIAHDEYDRCPSYRDDLDRFDRLLAEIKAEAQSATGNAAAMRVELNELDIDAHRMRWDGKYRDKREAENFVERVIDTIRRALAAPARNCDVGDAAEQSERLAKFCKANYEKEKKGKHICSECMFNDCLGECPLNWAQLPFAPAEGGKK